MRCARQTAENGKLKKREIKEKMEISLGRANENILAMIRRAAVDE